MYVYRVETLGTRHCGEVQNHEEYFNLVKSKQGVLFLDYHISLSELELNKVIRTADGEFLRPLEEMVKFDGPAPTIKFIKENESEKGINDECKEH